MREETVETMTSQKLDESGYPGEYVTSKGREFQSYLGSCDICRIPVILDIKG